MNRRVRRVRFLSLLLALALLLPAGVLFPAAAETVSLRVTLAGIRTQDGLQVRVPLTGSFRLWQNGREAGSLQAGGSPALLSGTDPIRLEPMPETFTPGWDLTPAYCTLRDLKAGENTVEILLQEGTTALPGAAGDSVPADGTDSADEADPADEANPADEAGITDETGAAADPEPDSVPADNSVTTDSVTADSVFTDNSTANSADTETADASDVSAAPVPAAEPAAPLGPDPALPPLPSDPSGGTVRVNVFLDKNGNGEQGNYEDGVPSVPVALEREDGSAAALTETGTDGQAVFTSVPAGSYRIHVWAPENRTFSKKGKTTLPTSNCMAVTAEPDALSDAFSLPAGATAERGVGLLPAVRISGFCWLETEADGIYATGEARLPGVRITLDGVKNGLHFETVSDAEGRYAFTRVKPGGYTLTAYTPEGMMFTRYSAKGRDNRSIITREGASKGSKTMDTSDGEDLPQQNIGFVPSGSVTGLCFLDANYNGLYDEGELPMKGVKVAIGRPNAEKELAAVFSGEDGVYTLPSLRGGTYRIRVVLPDDGCDFSRVVTDPLGNHFAARAGRRENFWNDFVLQDMETRRVNVGVIYPATVSGTVYMDNDFSGAKNGKEKIVSGFSVTLTDAEGNAAGSDKTNIKGVYEIPGVPPGEYTLRATALPGYAFTRTGEGNVMRNLSGGEGVSDPFRVELGVNRSGLDLGMILPGTVEGLVFADRNDNGLRDPGEQGLPGVTVRLMSGEGEAFRATVGEDGAFVFDAVMPGRYCLEYILPEDAVFAPVPNTISGGNTVTGGGTASGSPREGRGDWFDFATGAHVTAPLCGALTLGRITASIFHDGNGSGLQEEGEEPLAGLTLTLTPSRADLRPLQVRSDAGGRVAITGIHPDTWTLSVSCPEGMALSRTDALSLPLSPGLPSQTVSLPVEMGARWEEQGLGCVRPASLQGRVWLDENNNGLLDAGEQTPAGYTVALTDERTGRLYAALVTDGQGIFRSEGLIPGSYALSFTPDDSVASAKAGDSTFREENGLLVMTGVALTENGSREDPLLGLVRFTRLEGMAWIDRGGEIVPLSGAALTLRDESGAALASMITGESGAYGFGRLLPGVYRVEAELPEGCVVIEPGDERLLTGPVSILTETDGRRGVSDPIALRMGLDLADLDIGAVQPGTLGDFCWLDLNGDGLQGMGEAGVPGVRIELLRNGEPVASTVSDAYGFYRFTEVYPAVYTLRVTPPPEVKPTRHGASPALIASCLAETEETSSVSDPVRVESARANYNADAGFVCRTAGVYPAGYGEAPTQNWTGSAGKE
ncbi:MAG: hypothetical protein E7325_07870 [Clostridiales bacterium]|nr:hypothetical protein [Clostridiales bacterium]